MRIWIDFKFESAHRLPHVPEGHKCGRPHGHNYRVRIYASGPLVEPQDWIVDYFEIAEAWEPLRAILDHNDLNAVPGLENPTSERIAIWIWKRLKPVLDALCQVDVFETDNTGCEYQGD